MSMRVSGQKNQGNPKNFSFQEKRQRDWPLHSKKVPPINIPKN